MADLKSFALHPTDNLTEQINALASCDAYKYSKIRIMPDGHPGKGAVVGSTIMFGTKVIPDTVGVDLACRVSLFEVPSDIDLVRLDEAIHNVVPTGFCCRSEEPRLSRQFRYDRLNVWPHLSEDEQRRAKLSMGTLGSGNHYIELDVDDSGKTYLSIHCGSRSLGLKTANYYQNLATQAHKDRIEDAKSETLSHVARMREDGALISISSYLAERSKVMQDMMAQDGMGYLSGIRLSDYLYDMNLINGWSRRNHQSIYEAVAEEMGWPEDPGMITCIHNYVDVEHSIIRKGAISAREGELGIIPLNMRDGILIVRGKGNRDWNWSAPHGAGRKSSRKAAREMLSLDDYVTSMDGIYSSCVSSKTIDESPLAYKNASEIERAIEPTAEVINHLRPIYNFKDVPK